MNIAPSTECSLLDMTADELDIIMGYVDCKEIQVLRKVCSSLRQHIDNSQFDSKIDDVKVTETLEKMKLSFRIKNLKYTTIEYQMHPGGCLIKWDNKSKSLKDSDYAHVAGNDLGLILRHQKSIISNLELSFEETRKSGSVKCTGLERFLTALNSHLQSRKTLLPVHQFKIYGITKEVQLMKFIPHLKPKTLVEFGFCLNDYCHTDIKLNQVLQLDQWKLSQAFSTEYINYCHPLKTLTHFTSAAVKINQMTMEEIIELKNMLLQRIFEEPEWSGMTIRYSFTDRRKFATWLNVSYLDGKVTHIFRSDSNKHLKIEWTPWDSVIKFSVIVDPVV
uniref:FTH domain-containing protein n=1 Tax=Caenorhabditis tropicalis TaxID=1561998 RepID=A0A1I7TI94_9PELO